MLLLQSPPATSPEFEKMGHSAVRPFSSGGRNSATHGAGLDREFPQANLANKLSQNQRTEVAKNMARNATNQTLKAARSGKNDEFYTVLSDVEKELKHYRQHFEGKVVLCNCDDPRISNFFHYFSYNFEKLKLKRLITTCFKNDDIDLFSRNQAESAIWLEYSGDKNGNRVPDVTEIGVKYLEGNGDFRSSECVKLLEQADIVVTNPPFSLFREYLAQLIRCDKKFLIIGTWNAISYKETFELMRENKLWIGINSNRNFSGFIVPDHYPMHGTEARIDSDGRRIVSSNNTCWFTNMDNQKRHERLILYRTYDAETHPRYDNFKAIEVSRVNEIPKDYSGIMGVPITFLDKYNPDQFEIIGSDYDVKTGRLSELVSDGWTGKVDRAYLNGKRMYARLFIKLRTSAQ